MQIEELESPTFALNENGNVTVFVPEFAGEAANPVISGIDGQTLFFRRSPDAGCRLSGIPAEVMAALGRVKKCLVIELDLETVADLYEKDAADLETAFKKIYESDVSDIPAAEE